MRWPRKTGSGRRYPLTFAFTRVHGGFIIDVVRHVTHPASQLFHFRFFEAATSKRLRRTDTDTGSHERALRIVRWHAVFVHRDVSTAQRGVSFFTGQVLSTSPAGTGSVPPDTTLCRSGTLLPSLWRFSPPAADKL